MPPDTFNTGVLIVDPKEEVHQKLLEAAAGPLGAQGQDQVILNAVFPEWFLQPSAHRLSFSYNVLQTISQYYEPAWERTKPEMKVLHFAGEFSRKPWAFSGTVNPSLGIYVYLWQSLARAKKGDDYSALFDVLKVTDADEINALFRKKQMVV
mmetsp:Transcript_43660/g.68371  ORF Transcript_43660/g.68371 Transcript_43660/m.68371 type:complete len:152 (+) Transcript_43660:536-991(+)